MSLYACSPAPAGTLGKEFPPTRDVLDGTYSQVFRARKAMGNHDFASAASTHMRCALIRTQHSRLRHNMGRGKAWSVVEREKLAMAWVAESTDPRMGTNQDSKTFWATVLRRFQAFDLGGKLGYVQRPERSLRTTFQEISADCQKFVSTFRITKAALVTGGLSVDELVAVSVAMP
jgi:hypothetical protein